MCIQKCVRFDKVIIKNFGLKIKGKIPTEKYIASMSFEKMNKQRMGADWERNNNVTKQLISLFVIVAVDISV